MSTRCQIGIYGNKTLPLKDYEILMYKHCDGYPEGVLPTLEPIVKRFAKSRGLSDTEYAAAWILYEFMSNHVASNIEMSKEYKTVHADGKDFLGYGICGDKQIHGDIEFFYAVYPDRIEAYEAGQIDEYSINAWKMIKTIPI